MINRLTQVTPSTWFNYAHHEPLGTPFGCKTNPSDVTTYAYNIENQLIQVTGLTSQVTSYTYDGLGRRIEKNVNGTITRYVYDNEDIIAEYDGSNTLQAQYLHGPGVDEPLSMTRNSQQYYYHADGLGSITAITNSTGATVKTYRYDAFGNIISQTGTLVNPYTYTGREYDSETGLYYYRARYYEPKIGRFLQKDEELGDLINPQTLNLYLYTENNPIIRIDPMGLWYIDINFTGGRGKGGTFGIQAGPAGLYAYGGVGYGIGGGFSITANTGDPSPGLSAGGTISGGTGIIGVLGSVSYSKEGLSGNIGGGWGVGWGVAIAGTYTHPVWERKKKCK